MKLDDSVGSLPFVGPVYVNRLKKLNIETINDLLHHPPHRYLDFTQTSPISQVQAGKIVTIKGEVTMFKNIYTKAGKKFQLAQVSDKTGSIYVLWFNQPFLIRTLPKNSRLHLSGKVDWWDKKIALISPEFEKIVTGKKNVHTGGLIPVYPQTAGISSKWLRARVSFTLDQLGSELKEFLPHLVLKNLNLIEYGRAIKNIHFPINLEISEKSRLRLGFNELLMLQLKSGYRKLDWKKNKLPYKLSINKTEVNTFIDSLPFKLTDSQQRSVNEILGDLGNVHPMNRLLEGDVGSGKTVVGAIASFASFTNGHQTVFMAPTQILAQQHYETLNKIFKPFNVRVALITSGGVKSGPGKTDVFVGTHALIHKRLDFENVALVVIDEQQRFGVEQRAHLTKIVGKEKQAPHVLTMTATPIPRTVALTIYGDLDLSTLDELPAGRRRITTWVVPLKKRKSGYDWIEEQIKKDKVQAFVICPLIEESDNETMKQVRAASAEYDRLKKKYSSLNIDLLHGKFKVSEKDEIMERFKKGSTNILVSTPVVEVGIDVPNATIMVIEAAERFGLSQLHQLRGRVGRGDKKSYCLLFAHGRGGNIVNRLNALKKGLSGFELAELDLQLRGPGEIFGKRQSGFLELKIASWQDTELIKNTKNIAEEAIKNPTMYKALIEKLNIDKISPN